MRTKVFVFTVLLAIPAIAANDNPQRGRSVYEAVGCYQCHGYVGQGGAAGLRLAPDLLPYDAFAQFVRSTTGAMPAYSEDVLSDPDLEAIYAYMKTAPKTATVDSIPLLKNLR